MPPGILENLTTTIDLHAFLARLVFAAFLGFGVAFVYGGVYQPRGRQLRFVRLIPVLTVAMAAVTSVLASSHALAIGMVGAMSWIRFRNSVEDPRNQVVLLTAVGLGLTAGLGAFLTGVIFLGAFGLTLKGMQMRIRPAGTKVCLRGRPAEVFPVVKQLEADYAGIRMQNCALGADLEEWTFSLPGLSNVEWIKLSSFLAMHLPSASFQVSRDE